MCSTTALILAVSPAALAVGADGTATQTELSQAREYLMNYQRTETNRYGKQFMYVMQLKELNIALILFTLSRQPCVCNYTRIIVIISF